MYWRLITDGAADGATNMAVDEALLESSQLPDSMPTVRFYRFSSPTVTFGYGQTLSQIVDQARCRNLGIDCIRRITGGRALLHQHELTYSVAAPTTITPLFSTSVKSTYRAVRATIHRALERLGVPVDSEDAPSETGRFAAGLPCLSVPTGHEITVDGNKIVAASMRWRRRGFLLHGSILWSIDHPLWSQLTGAGPLRAAGIRDVCGDSVGEAELIEALTGSFEEVLGGPPRKQSTTRHESGRVRQLLQKYRSEAWNQRLEVRIPSG